MQRLYSFILKTSFIGIACFFPVLAWSSEKIETYFDCTVLGHSMVLVTNGNMVKYDKPPEKARVGDSLVLKLEFNGSALLTLRGRVTDTKTSFSYVGNVLKRLPEFKAHDPFNFMFQKGRLSIDMIDLSFGNRLHLNRVKDGQWDGNLISVDKLVDFPRVVVTSITCQNAGSAMRKLIDLLTDKGY
jgi:hypothetical protein